MTPRRRRRGFTLIELLVVISIIGILVGLLLPAINAAREAGRRAKCQSNMRNVVLGILGYVNNKHVFPPSGEFGEDATTLSNLTSAPPNPDPRSRWSRISSCRGLRVRRAGRALRCIVGWCRSCRTWTTRNCSTSGRCSRRRPPMGASSVLRPDELHCRARRVTSRSRTSHIGVLMCPDDNTIQNGQGNLSYVVNGGFALYQAYPIGWVGSAD